MSATSTIKQNGKPPEAIGSSYADARRMHIEREAAALKQAASMSLLAKILAATLALAMATIALLATQPKRIPVYVAENAQARLGVVGSSPGSTTPSANAMRASLAQWIENARSISSDPMATKERQRKVAAMVARASQAERYLADYIRPATR